MRMNYLVLLLEGDENNGNCETKSTVFTIAKSCGYIFTTHSPFQKDAGSVMPAGRASSTHVAVRPLAHWGTDEKILWEAGWISFNSSKHQSH